MDETKSEALCCPPGEAMPLTSFEGLEGAGEWVVTLGAEGPVIEHAHRKSDAAVRGPAGALLTVLTSRTSPEDAGVDVLGASELLTLWREQGAM